MINDQFDRITNFQNICNKILAIVFLFTVASAQAQELVLYENKLGPLKLTKGTKISKKILAKLFPEYSVSYIIGQGDSPDFHYFRVLDSYGNIVFTISSFIENSADANAKEVDIDILEVRTEAIRDQYGVSIGKKLSDVISMRGEDLKFGANHFDYHIGKGNIWYALSAGEINTKFGYMNPTKASVEDARKANPKVIGISWPRPRWD